jgi:hypothetical protein
MVRMMVSRKGCTIVIVAAAFVSSTPCLLLLLALALITHTTVSTVVAIQQSGGAMEKKKTMGVATATVMRILLPSSLSLFFSLQNQLPLSTSCNMWSILCEGNSMEFVTS